MKFRLLKESEIEVCSNIVRINYSKKWQLISKKELSAMFDHKVLNPKYFVAEEDGKIIGFAGYCTSWIDYHVKEIFWVNVIKGFQGKGVGTFILNELIKQIKKEKSEFKTKLIILSCKRKLVSFYHKFGFEQVTSFTSDNVLMDLKI